MTSNKDFLRKRQLKRLLEESILFMLSEDADPLDPTSSVPPSTPPVDPATNQTTPEVPPEQNQPPHEKEFDVDSMVEKLNVLRGGKSLKDPEIYGSLTGFFNKLSPEQKQMTEWLLTELGKIVIAADESVAGLPQHSASSQNAQPVPPAQSAPTGPQNASQAPTAPVTAAGKF